MSVEMHMIVVEHRRGNSIEDPLSMFRNRSCLSSLGCTDALDTDLEIVSQDGVNHG